MWWRTSSATRSTIHTPGGISSNGTQEFVADTFGASTEWYANEPSPYDTMDFIVGEQINLVGNGPIRYMYQPSLAGDKNCYDSSVPGGEVHAAAGPGSHCFSEFNTIKATWDAVSVPAQSGDPTCSGGSTGTVTVTNPGSQSSTVGTAVSLQLAAGGGTSPYTWTATGLPTGPSMSTAGKISGTPSAAGSFTVSATAKDAAAKTGSASFGWTVDTGGGSGSCAGQELVNPGFESGSTGWTASTGVITNDSGAAAHGGTYKAWLDGYGSTHTDTVSQSVTVPSGCTATLSYYLWIDSAETGSTAYDKLTVAVNGTTKATYSNVNKGTGYVKHTLTLSGFSGSVTIKFTGTEDSALATNFIIDDTALNLG